MEKMTVAKEIIVVKKSAGSNRPSSPSQPARFGADGKPIKNAILLSLPDDEFKLLHPVLEPALLPRQKILHEPGEKVESAYFLNEGIASRVALSHDGRSVEVGIVGKEGMIGMVLLAGLERGVFRNIMQMTGSGLRLRADVLKEVLRGAPHLRSVLGRFALVQGMQAAQFAACNRLHDIEQRLCRWLLMCQDRIDSELLPLTHEHLAQMLGTGRPSVSLAAGTLESAGLIENLRGSVKILNRTKLEEAACECYRVIQDFSGGLVA